MKYTIKQKIIKKLPKKIAHSLLYFRNKKRIINLKNPCTYDEKIHWLMVNTYDEKYSLYADKLRVREYIEKLDLGHILIDLYSTYSSIEEIDLSILPSRCIMKTNQGSGEEFYYLINETTDEEDVKNHFSKVMDYDFGYNCCQYHYSGIKPMLLCEKLLVEPKQERLDDYKIVCSYGVPQAILVCSDRDEGRDYFDCNWNYLDYVKPEYRSKRKIEKPEKLDEMLNYASIISKPFPLARVDFYYIDNKIYFGEITLTPSAGFHNNLTEFGQLELGSKITLPFEREKRNNE